jgi:hypothetical protein
MSYVPSRGESMKSTKEILSAAAPASLSMPPCLTAFQYVQRADGIISFYKDEPKGTPLFWVNEKEVKSRRAILRFIRHLSDKNWITGQHIAEFIDQCRAALYETGAEPNE